MNVLGYGKLWITTAKDRFNGWWTSKELDLVKRTLVAKLINFAKKIADRISKSATKNMDKGTAKRMAQLEDGMDPGKVYSDRNIKRTDRAAAIETKIDKAIDVVKDKIDGPAMPKQDLDKVLKISYDR